MKRLKNLLFRKKPKREISPDLFEDIGPIGKINETAYGFQPVSFENMIEENLGDLNDDIVLLILDSLTGPITLRNMRLTCKRIYVLGARRFLWQHWAEEQLSCGRTLDLGEKDLLFRDASAAQLRSAIFKSYRLHKNICRTPSNLARVEHVPLDKAGYIHPLHNKEWLITEQWDSIKIIHIKHYETATLKIDIKDFHSGNAVICERKDGVLFIALATVWHREDEPTKEVLYVHEVTFSEDPTQPPTQRLVFEKGIRDWRQGVSAGWRFGDGLIFYHPDTTELKEFLIEDIFEMDKMKRPISIPWNKYMAMTFHDDLLLGVAVLAEEDASKSHVDVFSARDIRRAMRLPPSPALEEECSSSAPLPEVRYTASLPSSNSISASSPSPVPPSTTPTLFSFDMASRPITKSGHVQIRVSSPQGPPYLWNAAVVKYQHPLSKLPDPETITDQEEEQTKFETALSYVISMPEPGFPPLPLQLQQAEERGSIRVDKYRDSLPSCFHVLQPLTGRPNSGAITERMVEECYPIYLPQDLRDAYVGGATISNIWFGEAEGLLLVGTFNHGAWLVYYV